MLFAQSAALAIVTIVLIAFVTLLCLAMFMTVGPLWLQSCLSGAPVMILDLIGMKLRRTDAKAVIQAMIVAKQGGVEIPWREMEKAWVQGAHLEKVTLAMIQATNQGLDLTFQDLVEADLEDRLADKLRHNDQRWTEEARSL